MLIHDLHLVLKVAEHKSIKKAGESLNMRTATASAALQRVEKAFGITFFQRSTRQLKLSSAGEKHLPKINQALELLSQIEQSAKNDEDVVDGVMRIAAPSDFGRNRLLPWLDELVEHHPKLSLNLHISDSNIDFYRESVDVALRYGPPKDSRMYGFKICDVPRVVCASPQYVAQHGYPEHPQALTVHNGLLYQMHDIVYDVWEFTQGSDKLKVKIRSNRTANDADLVRRWCVNGKGFAIKSVLDMSQDLLEDRLINILPNYKPTPTELWLICPSKQLITPAIRLLREQVTSKCEKLLSALQDKGALNLKE